VTIVNVLRRAEIEVTLASIESELAVSGTRGLRLHADKRLLDTLGHCYSLIALPGGEKGAEALGRNAPLVEMLHQQNDAKHWLAAICAAPALTLAPQHLLDGRAATCYPAFKAKLPRYVDKPVVVDGHFVTSQGPGTALAFALKLVEVLAGAGKSKEVATALLASM
ncbi:MAG: DJ-1/PfpI family protein, partial [Nevskia sp.]|nr:DJ-1/PfpI family protein [Nevskia sp.]